MSVRVCYMIREGRGAGLAGLRLVGQASDEAWSAGSAPGALGTGQIDSGATWIRQRVQASRTARSLTALVLDASAGVCSWITSPSREAGVVAAVARAGSVGAGSESTDGASRAGSALDHFAPSDPESSIEPLAAPTPGASSTRLAVLGVADVSARLLIDALDVQGLAVEQTSTIWHAMCAAWDPMASRKRAQSQNTEELESSAGITAIVLADPTGTLLWAWSRDGKLVAGGSLRLRSTVAGGGSDPDVPSEGDEPRIVVGADEASRLTTEWLGWSVQLTAAPSRVVCLMPEGVPSGEFGRGLTKLWPGATVDLAVWPDAIGLTLRKFADALEASSEPDAGPDDAGAMMMGLSQRPGRATRRAHLWIAGAIAGLAAVVFMASWVLSSMADQRREAALSWEAQWREAIKQVYPDALRPVPRVSPQTLLAEEIRRKERELLPVEQPEKTMPVLQELETISMVVGTGMYSLDRISLDPRRIEVTVVARSTKDAEDLLEALRRIGGSHAVDWTQRLGNRRDGQDTLIEARHEAQWNPDLRKGTPGATVTPATPAAGGGA